MLTAGHLWSQSASKVSDLRWRLIWSSRNSHRRYSMCNWSVTHSCKTPVTCELEYMFYQFGKGSEINALGNTPNPNCPFPSFTCLSFCFYLFVLFHDWYHSHIMFHAFQVHEHRIPQSWSSCRNWMRHKRLYKAKVQSFKMLSRSWTPIRKWQKSKQLLPLTTILNVHEELRQV